MAIWPYGAMGHKIHIIYDMKILSMRPSTYVIMFVVACCCNPHIRQAGMQLGRFAPVEVIIRMKGFKFSGMLHVV